MKRVIGIDPSLKGSAVVQVWEDGRHEILGEFGSLPAKTLKGRMARYRKLSTQVTNLVDMDVELVLIEGYAFSAKSRSTLDLAEYGATLRHDLLDLGLLVAEVPPTTLKKFVTGKGNASKIAVATALSARYRIEFATDNQSDAFALAQLAAIAVGYLGSPTKFQSDTVAIVKASINQEK